eukprot:TRINITY_DN13150_c0_g1_i1.p1 TRINITY_DN13150_c0_g1~~TRINITY_DN13150_c0_g1_i1.p1  ORF type:complete len:346 (-),score=74.07 TRINITY_DN13150_c0_g1_i1:136-1173(-)
MMKALQLAEDQQLRIHEVPKPIPTANQALVRVLSAALNRRDHWMTMGMYPGIKLPATLGADCCGVVEQVNSASKEALSLVGEKVVINCVHGWGSDPKAFNPRTFKLLGMPLPGTFAEYIVVDIDRLHKKPPHMTDEQAAALPLAGHTAFRAVFTKAQVKAGDTVLITGIGGGVALFALQFCVAAGANVLVTSGSSHKIQKAAELGAKGGVNYKDSDWCDQLFELTKGQRIDSIIDGTAGEGFDQLLRVLKPGGILVTYGVTGGKPPSINLAKMFLMQQSIVGTTMGTDQEFLDMLALVEEKKLSPVVDSVRPFRSILSAFEAMKESTQFGKLVVNQFSPNHPAKL